MARVGPPPLEEHAFRLFKQAVIARTGHHYYDDKDPLLWERVAKRLRATGAGTVGAYVELLADPKRGEAEWNALEAEITIGETFFFRFAEQFEALRRTILPAVIRANEDTRQIRVWSAGCSTGAEAYSVAIVLRELLGEAVADWRVGVVGTDINDAFLKTARAATYGKWALRSMPPQDRERWFTADGPNGPWTVRPVYKGLVHFERHNLMSLLDGTSPLQFTGFDLILCRNVLIYFHTEAVNRIVRALGECLAPNGWLLVGHAEASPEFTRSLKSVELPGAMAYRPLGSAADSEARSTQGQVPAEPAPAAVVRTAHGKHSSKAPERRPRPAPSRPTPSPPAAPAVASSPADLLSRLRSLADAGDLQGALSLAQDALASLPTDPTLHYYRGLLDQSAGRLGEAETAFRSALYLDRSFVMAHYQLGLLLARRGDRVAARRSLSTAARLAAGLPGGAELPEGDGLTAGTLTLLARAALQPGAAR
ncbi:protein-glutamate methyltransferase [Alsobacter soli]|uniref:protein-glutamate O-methyltransferase n=2 Tax=Alsobacter soli TaxID=2109933 RepID=A0A2T1HQL5_9HYPH|nr:protein-glutamate methyltransferase [Alsobacter soli]